MWATIFHSNRALSFSPPIQSGQVGFDAGLHGGEGQVELDLEQAFESIGADTMVDVRLPLNFHSVRWGSSTTLTPSPAKMCGISYFLEPDRDELKCDVPICLWFFVNQIGR